MKKMEMRIENMDQALAALNDALQQAMTLIYQKAAGEATVGLTISMEMSEGPESMSWYPSIKYKTSVRVPVEIRNTGNAINAQQVKWDNDERLFVMMVEGEQMQL